MRLDRERKLIAAVAGRNPESIRRGMEAYNRDLPALLAANLEQQVVAYQEDQRVGMAPTRDQLIQQLREKGLDWRQLFIKIVLAHTPVDLPRASAGF
jgi:hypothetical protein